MREENRRLQEKRSAERKASSRVEELEGIIGMAEIGGD